MSDINVIVNDEIVNIDIVDEPVLVNVVNSPGVPGAPGVGVPVGGTTGQVLAKNSDTNYDTEWVDVSGGAWGTITGTLSNQTDLQSALDAKFDDPTGTSLQYIDGTGALQTFPLTLPVLQQVRNQTGSTLDVGTVVYINGATGNLPTVTKAIATGDATSAQTLGIVSAAIANNGSGYVVVIGTCSGLDTSAYTEGQQLYLSGTTAGAVTTTKPYAPIHLVYVGIVTRSHPNLGTIEVRVQNGFEMDEIHNADAQNPNNNDGLFYNTTTSLWEHKQISTALGYTPANAATTLTINGVTYDLSTSRTWTIAAGISGSGASGQVAYWTGATSQAGSNNLFWDNANGRLGIGTNAPTNALTVQANSSDDGITLKSSAGTTIFQVKRDGSSTNTAELFSYAAGNIRLAIRSTSNLSYFNGGNFAFGSTTDSGERLQVTGTMKVTGASSFGGNLTFSSTTTVGYSNNSRTITFNDANSGMQYQGFGGHRFTSFNGSIYQEMLTITGNNASPKIGINSTTPNASAILDVASTTLGFLPPRMTTTQKNAISSPAAGLVVYDTTLAKLCVYTTAWETITSI
jgi:hypothetical protein